MTPGVSKKTCFLIAVVLAAGFSYGLASSHREAPFITGMPKVDGTDFYMFRSYEPGRDGFVTLIANYNPLQDPYGGPNYFSLDSDARYDIHINNDGDAVEDISFCFRFFQRAKFLTVDAGGRWTDFYMFRSYEEGRDGFVTLIADCNPLQDPYGGPNYFPLDPSAAYDIHINNNGGDNPEGQITEDITFRFRFTQSSPFVTVPVDGQDVAFRYLTSLHSASGLAIC